MIYPEVIVVFALYGNNISQGRAVHPRVIVCGLMVMFFVNHGRALLHGPEDGMSLLVLSVITTLMYKKQLTVTYLTIDHLVRLRRQI